LCDAYSKAVPVLLQNGGTHLYFTLVCCYKNNVSTTDVDWMQEIWGAFFLL